jgi:hypothetical protein
MPESVALPIVVESGWTKVARAIAIVRDLLLIFVLAALIYFGSAILARVGQSTGTDSTPVDPAITCPAPATPRADQWGTFCETPGG